MRGSAGVKPPQLMQAGAGARRGGKRLAIELYSNYPISLLKTGEDDALHGRRRETAPL